MILGIDEVGRGPWAGPLVVGAVVLGSAKIAGLTDSKKLTKKKREDLDLEIREKALGFGLGWVQPDEIDNLGLSEALKLATVRAVEQIRVPYHEIIIDGTVNFLKDTAKGKYVQTMKKADLLIGSVSAASIIAKVARDNYMVEQDSIYPGYGFKSNVGYGTALHIAALEKLGVCPLHRLSFKPLSRFRQPPNPSENGFAPGVVGGQPPYDTRAAGVFLSGSVVGESLSARQAGSLAEDKAAEYLQSKGHVIVARNWRSKYCEIDIISTKDDKLYFTEVKYRKTNNWGDGIGAITPRKLSKMKFAAEFYMAKYKSLNQPILAAIAIEGEPPAVKSYLEID